MVRLDKCVEALYDGDTMIDKHKSLHILKVMKGAISVSKSKTGDCMFRSNKTEKKDLERTIKIHQRNSVYNVSRIDTSKKLVVARWTKILEHQTTCTSQSLFEDLLEIGDKTQTNNADNPGMSTNHKPTDDYEDNKLKKLIDMRLGKYDTVNRIAIPERKRTDIFIQDNNERDIKVDSVDKMFVTEKKEIRDKLSSNEDHSLDEDRLPRNRMKVQGSVLAKSTPIRLPSITANAGFSRGAYTEQEQKSESEVQQPTLERDLTDWTDWRLKDKGWILGYIHREKTRHEDLIIRNALGNIEKEMSGANMIKRHQIRQKLQNERDAGLKKKHRSRIHQDKSVAFIEKAKLTSRRPSKKHGNFHQSHVNTKDECVEDISVPICSDNIRRTKVTPAKIFAGTLPVILENSSDIQENKFHSIILKTF